MEGWRCPRLLHLVDQGTRRRAAIPCFNSGQSTDRVCALPAPDASFARQVSKAGAWRHAGASGVSKNLASASYSFRQGSGTALAARSFQKLRASARPRDW